MDAIRFAAVWIALVLAFMLVALFGECECFEGTCIARAHGMLTGGLCEYGLDAVTRCFGTRGREAVENAVTQCCDRPNPLFQVRPPGGRACAVREGGGSSGAAAGFAATSRRR